MIKKIVLFVFTALFMGSFMKAQQQNYQLSTHILDISTGLPVPDVSVVLEKQNNMGTWDKIDEEKTDKNGRIGNYLPDNKTNSQLGTYRLTFSTQEYFNRNKVETFYPYIQVIFEIKDHNHYHVPITISPFGYSTYRGS